MRVDLLAEERGEERRRRLLWVAATVATACILAAAMRAGGVSLPPGWTGDGEGRSGAGDTVGPGAATQAASPGAPGTSSRPAATTGGSDGPATTGSEASVDAGDGKPRHSEAAVRTRPLSGWLTDVARDAGRDLVLSPELRGDLTASESTRLPWEERLEAYARVFGFDFRVSEGLIEVRREASFATRGRGGDDEARTKEEQATAGAGSGASVDAGRATSEGPATREEGEAASPSRDASAPAANAKPAAPVETRVARLAHAPAKEVAAVLSKAGPGLGVVAAPEPSSNALLLAGARADLDKALRVVAELDRPRRRVLLEAKIVEVLSTARRDLGVEWKLAGDIGGEVKFPPPLSDAGSAAVLVATGGASALDARISAMEADGRLRVVSRPSVVMLEGSPATIESVRILRIRLPSEGNVVGGEVVQAPRGSRATEDIPVGVRLEVTPAIRAASRILLRIRAKSSSLGAPLPPDDIPEELSRMVDAEVMVASGETAVLGGLTRDAGTDNGAGVPGVRRVPGLGLLFGKKSKEDAREELLILVTPRLLD